LHLSKKQLATVIVMIFGTFVTVLNQTLVTPALPNIMVEMSIDASVAQWLTTGFTLVNAIMIPVTAFLTDKFPTRRLFAASMVVFAVGSLLAGWGPAFGVLLAGRLLQAAGAGILMPMVMTVLLLTFPAERRGSAMGIFGLVVAFAPAVGPSLAGFVIDAFSWHVLFYIVTVLAIVVIVAGVAVLDSTPAKNPDATLDLLSVALSTAGFGCTLYGLSDVGSNGLTPVNAVVTLVGVAAVVAFFVRQLRMETPMLNVRVLKNPRFLVGTVIGMLVQAALLASGVLMPIYLQTYLGYSALTSGLVILPGAVLMGVMGLVVGPLFDRRGPRALALFGLGLLSLSTVGFVFLSPTTSLAWLTVLYTVRMFSLSFVNMPITTWAMNSLDDSVMNHGTSVNNTLRQVAGSLGTAVLISISTAVSSSQAPALGTTLAGIHGVNAAFFASLVLSLIGLVLAVVFVRNRPGEEAAADPTNARRSAVEAVMKRDVYTLSQDATVYEAVQTLVEKGISAAPVVDGSGALVGFVSDGDVTRYLAKKNVTFTDPVLLIMLSASEDDTFHERVDQLMELNVMSIATRRVVSADVHTDLPTLCRVLGDNHLKKIPITDGGRLVGVVNRSDIARYSMAQYLQAAERR
jgi:EmrB/QacA subfamily drug resistance transporter